MDWRALEATVDQTMASAFGEAVRLSFMKDGAVDPDRPAVDIRAVLHVGGDDSKPMSGGGEWRTRLSAGAGELFIGRSTYTGSEPKTGDRVRATERTGAPWFEVSRVSDRYSNLLVLSLTQT